MCAFFQPKMESVVQFWFRKGGPLFENIILAVVLKHPKRKKIRANFPFTTIHVLPNLVYFLDRLDPRLSRQLSKRIQREQGKRKYCDEHISVLPRPVHRRRAVEIVVLPAYCSPEHAPGVLQYHP